MQTLIKVYDAGKFWPLHLSSSVAQCYSILRNRGRSQVQTPAGSSLFSDFSAVRCPHYVATLMYGANFMKCAMPMHWGQIFGKGREKHEGTHGFESWTYCTAANCSITELYPHHSKAVVKMRTRGKLIF